jgi:sugar phosphate isomerase/epimerase
MERRRFLSALAAAAPASLVSAPPPPRKRPGPICFFSKHLATLAPGEMARALRAAGYAGIELTVRPGGHVLPEKVTTELPRAVEAIRAEGLEVPIIATAIKSADDPTAGPILGTAAKLGVRVFRPGWYDYALADVRKELAQAARALEGLVAAARRSRVELAYMNHVGNVGSPVWDLDQLMQRLDRRWAGAYFDIRHAVAEGGAGSWRYAAHLVAPRVKVFSVKDFYWHRPPGASAWAMKDCALGEGMVDVRTPLEVLAKHGFAGPITVFLEYKPGAGPDAVLAAAARDRQYLEARIAEAYG